MEIKYVRNANGSHMILKQAGEKIEWERKMLLQNPPKELLLPDFVNENGEELLWYHITGRQALDIVLDTKEMDYETLRQICDTVTAAAEKLEGLLLLPDAILLKPECIFIENQSGRVSFCYYPGNPVKIGNGFHELMQYLLRKLNHKDTILVEEGYRIFEETANEGYSLTEVLRLPAGESGRGIEIDLPQEAVKTDLPETESVESREERQESPFRISLKSPKKYRFALPDWKRRFLDKKKKMVGRLSKKKKEENIFIFEPEEAEEKKSRPTVLLSEINQRPQGILKYEGEGVCLDLRVKDTPFIIGSDESCDGVIESGIVSRRHAKITRAEEVYFIEDLNSSNGTYVGGKLLNCRVKMSLQKNETVLFGNEKFRFI